MRSWKRNLLATVLTLGLLGAAAPAVSASPGAGTALDSKTFVMPSRNIACLFDSGRIRCDIFSGLQPAPARACDYFWKGVMLSGQGKAHYLCIIDTVYDPKAPVLRYGMRWHRDGIACRSSTAGLRCHNRLGHGFFLSRERSHKW